MKCEFCKKENATIHLTQLVNGEMKKLNLCQSCAKEHGIDLNSPISITDVLMGIEKQKKRNPVTNLEKQYELTCKRCNLSRTEFSKKARLGCPECYKTFKVELKSITQAMHHSMEHVGKVPSKQEEDIKISAKIKLLKKEIDKSVKNEDYESAAKFRDEIKGLIDNSKGKISD
tara:strand:- start:987 stop:1505 length:519 start_codon:yes stop_codon:yes gene_type:complete